MNYDPQPYRPNPYPSMPAPREDRAICNLRDPDYLNASLIDQILDIQSTQRSAMGPVINRMVRSRNETYPTREVTVASMVFWWYIIDSPS